MGIEGRLKPHFAFFKQVKVSDGLVIIAKITRSQSYKRAKLAVLPNIKNDLCRNRKIDPSGRCAIWLKTRVSGRQ